MSWPFNKRRVSDPTDTSADGVTVTPLVPSATELEIPAVGAVTVAVTVVVDAAAVDAPNSNVAIDIGATVAVTVVAVETAGGAGSSRAVALLIATDGVAALYSTVGGGGM